MILQYEFYMTKDAGCGDDESSAPEKRLEAYAEMLRTMREKKEREDDAEQN